jgi:hypothetical protein
MNYEAKLVRLAGSLKLILEFRSRSSDEHIFTVSFYNETRTYWDSESYSLDANTNTMREHEYERIVQKMHEFSAHIKPLSKYSSHYPY